ncbi:two-component system OmpR family sensor kinase [Actinoplanes tereljensis]|uniref:histidine kinase n=1 Tax=Paractinoplanes tereljensis TaxID=571912 RepID=A0A919NJY8_9ACTN|nr:HAMP domain-containing sensor histidine kinase [Actinoplanes tereljensis]GIF19558.1 two-component sensor histidine kinase [Actinoplanes tereljensis]
MITLLAIIGVAVGGTAELILRQQLYDQIDAKLDQSMNPGRGNGSQPFNGGGNQHPPEFNINGPSPGSERGSITASYDPADTSAFRGGVVTLAPSTSDTSSSSNQYTLDWIDLDDAAKATLIAVKTDGSKSDVDLGSFGSFRVTAEDAEDGRIKIVALPLEPLHKVLFRVALVTGGAVLIALVIAGWAGVFIVRGTLRPLRRVASTATRVSELRLDRGVVQLAQRVPEADTDPRTEVGQVGAALNQLLDHVGNALEARHASEMQVRQFVADASHELRTPLAAIRGYAELSRRSRAPISEEIAHVLSRVESEAQRMTGLVEDLLLLARLDAGRPLGQDPVDLTMLVVDAVSDAHAAGPRHYWQLDLPEEPVTVVGDGARLHQVVANLLANARTHTPEGTTVTVSVRAGQDAAVVHVIDGGPGIAPELQPHIFERFARGDSSRSRAAGSTGLGLSIVHAVVTAHRGNVSVQSVPGQTVFTVVLPLAPADLVPTAGQLPQTVSRSR